MIGFSRNRRAAAGVARGMLWLMAGGMAATVAATVEATTLVSIGDGQTDTWADALADGRITPADELTGVAEEFYAQSIASSPTDNLDSAQAVQPRLEAMRVADIQGLEFDSLVMSWDPPASSTATTPGTSKPRTARNWSA